MLSSGFHETNSDLSFNGIKLIIFGTGQIIGSKSISTNSKKPVLPFSLSIISSCHLPTGDMLSYKLEIGSSGLNKPVKGKILSFMLLQASSENKTVSEQVLSSGLP